MWGRYVPAHERRERARKKMEALKKKENRFSRFELKEKKLQKISGGNSGVIIWNLFPIILTAFLEGVPTCVMAASAIFPSKMVV